jgi:hypothetical protein
MTGDIIWAIYEEGKNNLLVYFVLKKKSIPEAWYVLQNPTDCRRCLPSFLLLVVLDF